MKTFNPVGNWFKVNETKRFRGYQKITPTKAFKGYKEEKKRLAEIKKKIEPIIKEAKEGIKEILKESI